ncbi:hypothetical protein E2C01_065661 [Portunus trituberculatus]|uniref:Uncharacterized protein n=1 Tax=Portunus trituberculatus TaxID=210409 RepID=A0A5B7HSD5_PORTR|nr:hypothetical protein [Portunus trituberculatus]
MVMVDCRRQLLTDWPYHHGDSSHQLRPPELLLFSTLEVYLRWFTWKKEPKAQLNPILNASHLIDGAGRCVCIHAAHVSQAASYIHALTTCNDPTVAVIATNLHAHIFGPIHHHQQQEAPATEHYQQFVDTTDMRLNVVVFKAPFPSNLPEFFVHIILTMGHFNTKQDIYGQPNMTAALRAANLIGNDDPDETDVKNITCAYVTDQLLWYPFGSQAFSKHLSDALQTLQSILLEPQLHSPLPSTTEKDIADAIRDDLIISCDILL